MKIIIEMNSNEKNKIKYDTDINPCGKTVDADLKEIVKLIMNNKVI